MKSIIDYAIFFAIAAFRQCTAQGLGTQWVDPGPQLPGVWLYKGKTPLSQARLYQ